MAQEEAKGLARGLTNYGDVSFSLYLRRVGARPPEHFSRPGFRVQGLAVTYFRMRLHTIIGAYPFHGPVRDGKAWVQAAMASIGLLSGAHGLAA